MKLAIAAACAALALGGCVHGLSAADQHQLLQDLKDLGCYNATIDVETGGSTGQLGGEAHATFKAHGACTGPVSPAPAPTP